MKTTTEFTCVVDRDLSLSKMIDAGKYNHVDGEWHIITGFSVKGDGKIKTSFELVSFYRGVISDTVHMGLSRRGLRPADIAELLAFGAAFPEEQKKSRIVGFGSRVEINRFPFVAALSECNGRRGVELCEYGFSVGWWESDRFLAVRD